MSSVVPAPPTRDQYRSARKRLVRATTIRSPRRHLRLVQPIDEGRQLPATRGDCENAERPCPYVSCRHHLYLDVNTRTGSIKLNFPDIEPDQLEHSCSLDVADNGGGKLEDVGACMNVTRERIRQIERIALAKLAFSARPYR